MAAANRATPRGETPLVYSVLQSATDLKAVGAGTVIVITDGEESCGGNMEAATASLTRSGVDVTLDIVGFTVSSKQVGAQLAAFTQANGGRFYSAKDGEALARALLVATVETFPYTIYDAQGRQVATGEAGAAAAELPPGDYTISVMAGEQELKAGPVSITAGGDIVFKVMLEGDRFTIAR